MIEELQIRGFAPGTQKGYLSCVSRFARHFGRSPDQLGPEDVRAFLLHLVNEAKVSHGVLVNFVSALRFLYKITLQQPWDLQIIPYPRREKHLPEIPTREEILHLLGCVRNLKHRAILMTCYAAGLRVAEAVSCDAAVSWRPPSQGLSGGNAGAWRQANPALRSQGRKGRRGDGSSYPAGRVRLTAGAASVVYREAV